MKKQCSKCGESKELEEFYGRATYCNKCSNKGRKIWYETHRTQTLHDVKKWAKNNPEKIILIAKRRNRRNIEKLTDWYIKNLLYTQLQITWSQIIPQMIQTKREQLMVHRALKQFKEAINE